MLLDFISILNAGDFLERPIVSFLLWIDSIGYWAFNLFYRTFIRLAQNQLFRADAFENIYENMYIIMGVVALFLISYMLLKAMVDSDASQSNKQLREMGIRFIVAMIATIFLPTIFYFLIDVQNALLEYNVVPKFILEAEQVDIQYVNEEGENEGEPVPIDETDIDLTSEILNLRSNQMVATVISGLMYPLKRDADTYDGEMAEVHDGKYYEEWNCEEGTPDSECNDKEEWTTDVSEWWDGKAKFWAGFTGCIISSLITIFATPWGVGASILMCGVGQIGALNLVGGIASITAKEYTWTNALQAITLYGNFSQISLFADEIVQGNFHYTPIISTIVIGILVTLIIGFCIDVVVRQAKLVFYQMLAPICFMISVIPSKKDLMKTWFKKVISIWLEVFIRVGIVCAIVLLVGRINFDELSRISHPILSTITILGIVIFAKQIPKIIKDLTGLDSGNIKLNLREKLAEGGFFAGAGFVLGGAKRFARGVGGEVKNNFEQDEQGKWHRKTTDAEGKPISHPNLRLAASPFIGAAKSIPGVISSQIGSAVSGYKAKNWKDMMSGVNASVAKSEKHSKDISKYIADHGNNIPDVAEALGKDAFDLFLGYIGFEPDYQALKEQKEAVDELTKTIKSIKATSEDYVDKHKYEFRGGVGTMLVDENGYAVRDASGKKLEITEEIENNYAKWQEAIKRENDTSLSQQERDKAKELREKLDAQAAEIKQDFRDFESRYRLDVMEARIEELKKKGASALELADADGAFKKARKDLADAFVTSSQSHKGAEQEARILSENISMLNKQLEDLSTSAVVKSFHDGVEGIFKGVKETKATMDTAADFVKYLKKAADVTEANINRQYNELQRKNAKKPGNKNS